MDHFSWELNKVLTKIRAAKYNSATFKELRKGTGLTDYFEIDAEKYKEEFRSLLESKGLTLDYFNKLLQKYCRSGVTFDSITSSYNDGFWESIECYNMMKEIDKALEEMKSKGSQPGSEE